MRAVSFCLAGSFVCEAVVGRSTAAGQSQQVRRLVADRPADQTEWWLDERARQRIHGRNPTPPQPQPKRLHDVTIHVDSMIFHTFCQKSIRVDKCSLPIFSFVFRSVTE